MALIAQPASPLQNAQDTAVIRSIAAINTTELEYAPTITVDGGILYFVSNRPGGVGGHDFWYATRRQDGGFSAPFNLGPPVNTNSNEGVATIAADGQTIFFTGCNRSDGMGDCDIYRVTLEGNEWTDVELVRELNSSMWDSQPTLSSDGREIFFMSNRPGAIGGEDDVDIWTSTLGPDGKWSKPKNLGAPINTSKKEDSPFILPGGSSLYFSSEGHPGLGGLDFFVATRDTSGRWGTPQNLGAPFNTPKDERFITVPASNDVVYFSSERKDYTNVGKFDIYAGSMIPGRATILVSGSARDGRSKGRIAAHVVVLDSATGKVIYGARIGSITGKYTVVVDARAYRALRVLAVAEGYEAIDQTLTLPGTDRYIEISNNLVFARAAKGKHARRLLTSSPIVTGSTLQLDCSNVTALEEQRTQGAAASQAVVTGSAARNESANRPTQAGGYQVDVIDAFGHRVITRQSASKSLKLDVKSLRDGVYVVRAGTETAAFVVKRPRKRSKRR